MTRTNGARGSAVARALGVALLAALVLFFTLVPILVERGTNRVLEVAPIAVGERARALHADLFVADLHADSLLWHRDLLQRGDRGHVDLPRLREGGVALQVFGVVTRTPAGQNYDHNPADAFDMITLLAVAQRWPVSAWGSLKQRALWQAERLRRVAASSGGTFRILESAADVRRFAADRRAEPRLTAGLLAIEGLHALEGDPANLDDLRAAGFRMLGLAHFFDNELGGSLHGMEKGGLTPLGRQVVTAMQAGGIVVDLAHSSPAVFDDVLAMTTRPVVVSHTGVRGTCDHVRNLSDEQLRGIAAVGGLVGIGYWDAAVCDVGVAGIVRAIVHVARTIGAQHVALGSDFDGATTVAFDTAGIPMLTQGLLDAGLSEAEIRLIMGDNVRRVLEQTLPGGEG